MVGHKIGLTSRAMQMASKMTEPDYGRILDDALYNDGAQIPADSLSSRDWRSNWPSSWARISKGRARASTT